MKKLAGFAKGVWKVISFMLFRLGLWIPAVFTLLFFIVLAVTNTPFSMLSGVFVFGLITTFVFAAAFVFLTAFRKLDKKFSSKKRGAENYVAEPKKKHGKVEYVKGAEDDESEFTAGREEQVALFGEKPDEDGNGRDEKPEEASGPVPAPEPAPRDERDDRRGAYAENDGRTADNGPGFIPYDSVRNVRPVDDTPGFIPYGRDRSGGYERDSANRDYGGEPRQSFRLSAGEQPRIFRTRMDPDLLIYEYSDRLDFYRVEPDGRRVLVSSEKKNGYR